MFEYKIGDKVRCKKFRKGEISNLNIYNGTEYNIVSVWFIGPTYSPIVRIGGVDFRIDEFYDYFYSKKEMRQMKLILDY